ncbi:MAG: TetR/AcrR family transcriptional regulator [Elusimicrobiota bacterium]|nr:TetR/AcrR family transcriptional regulator [Elusimicrobiota bacterium]
MNERPETRKGGNTRQKIILSAIRLAARHGFAEASFQMIADDIGLSQSAVMYHFPDKNALFEELVKTIIAHNHEVVSGLMGIADGAGSRLLKHCLGNVMWALRYRRQDAQILILLYYLAGRGENFSGLFTQMIAAGRERIMAHLLAGVREGLFRLKGEPAAVAEIIQDSLFGSMLYAASAPEGSVGSAELEGKWKDFIAALTGWKDKGSAPILPRLPKRA